MEDVQDAKGVCIQPNGEELMIRKVGNVTLQVLADGKTHTVSLQKFISRQDLLTM